jgi:hypothetical protein
MVRSSAFQASLCAAHNAQRTAVSGGHGATAADMADGRQGGLAHAANCLNGGAVVVAGQSRHPPKGR